MEELQILPLAVTMMVGPGIMASIVLVTAEDAVRVSIAYVLGVLVSTAAFTLVWFVIAGLLEDSVTLGRSSDSGSAGTIIQLVLVALLVAMAVKNYVKRETIEPPRWLGKLIAATPGQALKAGLLLIPLMPSDEIIMATIGINLVQSSSAGYVDALPFVGLTALVAACRCSATCCLSATRRRRCLVFATG